MDVTDRVRPTLQVASNSTKVQTAILSMTDVAANLKLPHLLVNGLNIVSRGDVRLVLAAQWIILANLLSLPLPEQIPQW